MNSLVPRLQTVCTSQLRSLLVTQSLVSVIWYALQSNTKNEVTTRLEKNTPTVVPTKSDSDVMFCLQSY